MESIFWKKGRIFLIVVYFLVFLTGFDSLTRGADPLPGELPTYSTRSGPHSPDPESVQSPKLPTGFNAFRAVIAKGSSENSKDPFAYLVVHIELFPNFHLYTMDQKEGGYPTTFRILSVNIPSSKGNLRSGNFVRACPPVDYVPLMKKTLKELKGTIEWFVPLYLDSGDKISPEERSAIRKNLKISAEMDALACSSGDKGACFRVDLPFDAYFDSRFPIDPLLNKAKETVASDAKRDLSASSKNPVSAVNEKGSSANRPVFSLSILLWAFLGGLILNVMPCVLPVIGLKIISFFEQSGQSRSRALWLNAWYTFGILIVFGSLALMSVGLSYLFTYGLFQIIMGTIVFAMALNLMGIWELRLPGFLGGRKSNELMQKEGASGAIFKGIITTLLAIPCGAPLLSPVLVWSDSMIHQGHSFLVFVVYMIIGLGMGSPYLLIGAFPEFLRFLPKPGQWMETFRNIMGYVLLGAVIWILFSMPVELILPMITLIFAIWFVCWWIGRIPFGAKSAAKVKAWGMALLILAAALFGSFNIPGLDQPWTLQNAMQSKLDRWAIRAQREGKLNQDHWKLFDPALFEKERKSGRPVIVDFTADWCMNCKVLESTVLHSEDVLKEIEQKKILTFTADWTYQNNQSEEIKMINALLDQYGGRQVPTVMLFNFDSNGDPIVYRGLFSKKTLMDTLKKSTQQK